MDFFALPGYICHVDGRKFEVGMRDHKGLAGGGKLAGCGNFSCGKRGVRQSNLGFVGNIW